MEVERQQGPGADAWRVSLMQAELQSPQSTGVQRTGDISGEPDTTYAYALLGAPQVTAASMELAMDPDKFRMADVVGKMNKGLAGTGASVELKRKLPNGAYTNAQSKDTDAVDTQVRISAAAAEVKDLDRPARLAWSRAKREEGNALYKAGNLKEACEVYTCALVGMDFGSEEAHRREAVEQVQVPVLLNLAACKMAGKEWAAACTLVDKAIDAAPGSHKAWLRRARIRLAQDRLADARNDVRRAMELAQAAPGGGDAAAAREGEGKGDDGETKAAGDATSDATSLTGFAPATAAERAAIGKTLREVVAKQQAEREHRAAERKRWASIEGAGMYSDKPAPKPAEPTWSDTDDDDDDDDAAAARSWCGRLRDCFARLLGAGSSKSKVE